MWVDEPTMDFAASQQESTPSIVGSSDERRRDVRMKRKFLTQMTPWAAGHASVPFDVLIEDISDVGIGLVHERELEIGLRHLLTVPRANGLPVVAEYTVVRCDARRDGRYLIGLELTDGSGRAGIAEKPRKNSHLKVLLLALSLAGLMVALFAPL
jgi:hypothetical protein